MTDRQDDTKRASPADDPETAEMPTETVESELAWSLDDGEQTQVLQRHSWRAVSLALVAILACAVAVGALALLWLSNSRIAATSPPPPITRPASSAAGAPPPVTVTAPPPVTVTVAPPKPTLEGVDARFISFLRNNDAGSVYVNVSDASAIANARLICVDMQRKNGFQNVADNLHLSSAQIAWFADTASANFCPQLGGDV